MASKSVQLLLFAALAIAASPCIDAADDASSDWWRTASFYQIYPRSFQDSNGDGIGDLNGIIARLPYLADNGITATWLSPIFRSPQVDNGYDIADFFDIQPEYGTLADFDRLIVRARELGVRIVLDFVPNHTSDQNEWFRRSVRREPDYVDFYVWHPGHVAADGQRRPPNNWVSMWRGSAWTFHPVRQEYYLHTFSDKQPELNYRSATVVEQMHAVLRFWMDRGVAGFRVDAVSFLFEKQLANGSYPDEPLSGATTDPDDYGYLDHVYTINLIETIDMVYAWRRTLDEYRRDHGGDQRVLLAECYISPIPFYGNETHEGAQIPFNLNLIWGVHGSDAKAKDYQAVVENWMNNMPQGRIANWVIGNHDVSRVATRQGTDRIDTINMLLLTLPGISVTYYGEEIGMTDGPHNHSVDPAEISRDPERTPMHWDNSTSAGFSTNISTWLPVAPNYRTVNVRMELEVRNSHLLCYRKLMALRQTETMQYGRLQMKSIGDNVLVFVRALPGSSKAFVTVLNFGDQQKTVNLKALFDLPSKLRYAVVSVSSRHREGDRVHSTHVILKPFESVLLQSGSDLSPRVVMIN